mmetsp:Transcript_34879/g.110825  ORF Transcript_34879/g.110825 Transcript_34879/m.110825 type:complete len:331 (+) Transcript_34879:108-1100(+)
MTGCERSHTWAFLGRAFDKQCAKPPGKRGGGSRRKWRANSSTRATQQRPSALSSNESGANSEPATSRDNPGNSRKHRSRCAKCCCRGRGSACCRLCIGLGAGWCIALASCRLRLRSVGRAVSLAICGCLGHDRCRARSCSLADAGSTARARSCAGVPLCHLWLSGLATVRVLAPAAAACAARAGQRRGARHRGDVPESHHLGVATVAVRGHRGLKLHPIARVQHPHLRVPLLAEEQGDVRCFAARVALGVHLDHRDTLRADKEHVKTLPDQKHLPLPLQGPAAKPFLERARRRCTVSQRCARPALKEEVIPGEHRWWPLLHLCHCVEVHC